MSWWYLSAQGQDQISSLLYISVKMVWLPHHHWTPENEHINWMLDLKCGHQFRPFAHGAVIQHAWWRHQLETISALLFFCAGNSPAIGEFHAQRPVTRSFGVFFDLRLQQQLSKQWRRRWFETLSLRRHCNGSGVCAACIVLELQAAFSHISDKTYRRIYKYSSELSDTI